MIDQTTLSLILHRYPSASWAHRALEFPIALGDLETGAGAGGGEHRGDQPSSETS